MSKEQQAEAIRALEDYINAKLPVVISFVLEVVIMLIIFWISCKVIKWVCNVFKKFLTIRDVEPSAIRFLVSCVRAGLYFLVIVTLAMQLGLKEASVVAVLGSVGVGLGLALQGG